MLLLLGVLSVSTIQQPSIVFAEETTETQAETEPQTSAPETSAPETAAPETSAPETSAPETQAPETAATETQVPETQATEVQTQEIISTEAQTQETVSTEAQTEIQTETQETQAGTQSETQSETQTESTASKESKETEKDETQKTVETATDVTSNIVGFSVDPSSYPAADVGTNTTAIYQYLTETMGLNHAAACGVLANIHLESNFNPLALGDSGSSYGICQWHNGRFNNLISYCNASGLDYNTLDGQLAFLQYELSTSYPSVLSYIQGVSDTAQGAYDAAYYWCVHFEAPANTLARAAQRGNLAMNEYFVQSFVTESEETEEETQEAIDAIKTVRTRIDLNDRVDGYGETLAAVAKDINKETEMDMETEEATEDSDLEKGTEIDAISERITGSDTDAETDGETAEDAIEGRLMDMRLSAVLGDVE